MTVGTQELSSSRNPRAAVWSLSRDDYFAGLFFLGCANGLLGRIILSSNFDGWVGAILSVDINVIVFFACFAGVATILSGNRTEPREGVHALDLAVGAVFLGLVILPIFALSWVAVTGLGLYVLLFARADSERVRGTVILLALTVPMLWSRLIFQFFAKFILDIDALLVATLLHSDRAGNMVKFADGSGYMVVLAPCSSLANMSLAFLCWISVTQWFKHRWSRMDLLWSALACASVIAVNVTRISLMGVGRGYYDAIHNPWGDLVTNTVMLALMLGFSVLGARREIFSRV